MAKKDKVEEKDNPIKEEVQESPGLETKPEEIQIEVEGRPFKMSDYLLGFKKLNPNAVAPIRKTDGSAGYDLASPVTFSIEPGETIFLRTGLVVQIPKGWAGIVKVRSSMFKEHQLQTMGSCLIDSDYCGPEDELIVPLYRFRVQRIVNIVPPEYSVERRFENPDTKKSASVFLSRVKEQAAVIKAGTRIAQLLLVPHGTFDVKEFEPDTESRGGFGSTDKV